MANKLEVWLFANRIGTLALVQGRLSFQYATEWLDQPNAVALVMLVLHTAVYWADIGNILGQARAV